MTGAPPPTLDPDFPLTDSWFELHYPKVWLISGVALRVANQISGVASATPGPPSEHTPVGNVGFQAQAEIIYFFQIFGKFLHQRHY